jgi:hypothetical protein
MGLGNITHYRMEFLYYLYVIMADGEQRGRNQLSYWELAPSLGY